MSKQEEWQEFYEWVDQEGKDYFMTQVVKDEVPEEIRDDLMLAQVVYGKFWDICADEAAKHGVTY
jgi:hypothetical protein